MTAISKSSGNLIAIDNGTNTVIYLNGVKLFALRDSDKQMLVIAGLDTDQVI